MNLWWMPSCWAVFSNKVPCFDFLRLGLHYYRRSVRLLLFFV